MQRTEHPSTCTTRVSRHTASVSVLALRRRIVVLRRRGRWIRSWVCGWLCTISRRLVVRRTCRRVLCTTRIGLRDRIGLLLRWVACLLGLGIALLGLGVTLCLGVTLLCRRIRGLRLWVVLLLAWRVSRASLRVGYRRRRCSWVRLRRGDAGRDNLVTDAVTATHTSSCGEWQHGYRWREGTVPTNRRCCCTWRTEAPSPDRFPSTRRCSS